MRIFSALMDKMLEWSKHPKAPWFLGGLSFAESSFFPIPPDVMLAPMVLAKPRSAWRLATITTVASVLGGMAGFAIGMFALDIIEPVLRDWGKWETYEHARDWFAEWGIWAVFIAGFSPIPYKIFTIAAGAMSMAFLPFVVASAVGRGARFFLVAGLIAWGGPKFEAKLREYVDVIGWSIVALIVVAYVLLRG
ncbi:MAG: membrane protein YqaA with SNARE-associated domain [Gammaproteobacteria bacterium]|jgi:membrane protein YqaA with SNARE-associated domain